MTSSGFCKSQSATWRSAVAKLGSLLRICAKELVLFEDIVEVNFVSLLMWWYNHLDR